MMFENNTPAKRLLPILHESEKEKTDPTINSDPSTENFLLTAKFQGEMKKELVDGSSQRQKVSQVEIGY
jgi:hypothetical protein